VAGGCLDMRVTSAARKSQRAEDVAAAMYVITRHDIRRSGLTTLPEVLRLAPGVQVAPHSGVQLSASVARTGHLRRLGVPAYTRLDARAEFRVNSRLTAAAVGQNLLSSQHAEFTSDILYLTSGMPRSARLDLRWEF
jgi:outer membrane receptor protein involved in Fe transport